MLKENRTKKIAALVAGGILLVAVIGYAVVYMQAKTKFMSGTVINNIDVSGMKLSELKERMQKYSISVEERNKDGKTTTETVKGQDFDVKIGENEQAAENILKEQSVWKYLTRQGREYTISDWLEYDEKKLTDKIRSLKCFDSDFATAPSNAKISEYTTNGYSIIAENEGNRIEEEKVVETVVNAIHQMDEKVSLEKEDCYQKPAITSDSEVLKKALEKANRYTSTRITYQFGDSQEVLDGAAISKWIKVNQKNQVIIDKNQITEYVATLRKKYDTIFSSRKFKTSYGNTVTVNGGDYGWWMNYQKEEKELLKLIKKGTVTERTPEYFQTAEKYGKKDYGNTYVEINLTTQHLFLYVKGKKILDSGCVTGNASRGYDTPAGTYGVTYTQKDATLNGENYSTPVKYWMPFNGNIGMHDASWRSSFGGTIYKYNGSHGCVNLPPAVAKKVFQYVKAGTPVICYKSEGKKASEKKTTVKKSNEKKATVKKTSKKKPDKKTSSAAKSKKKAKAKKKNK
ncbi:MAG: L,D-transpeptidase family protein [Butyribacter sp.]|nr:L,D-transpeptidase family protein [bacterium]MDY3855317.1 L,D-transpeptidase family protein [Butyribacter sp.]